MSYLYETHCHASRCSRCAHSTPAELVHAYHRAGYAGLVLTDHFVLGNTAVDTTLPWEAQVRQYQEAFLEAKEAAEGLDFDVIFSIEHACEGTEYLCYGITPELLLSTPEIPIMSLEAFSHWAHGHDVLVIQAHPFREAHYIDHIRLFPREVHGVEVINANRTTEENAMAKQYAAHYGLLEFAGSDNHSGRKVQALAGMESAVPILNEQDFVRRVKAGQMQTFHLHP